MSHPLLWALGALAAAFVIDEKVMPLGLEKINPLSAAKKRLPPESPPPARAQPIPGSPSVIVPPIPTLPPLPGLPAIPSAGERPKQVDKVPPFVPGVLDNGEAIQVGDVVNVDMFRSGMSIPQNVPVVGLIFMNVDSLSAPGDTGRSKVVASFVSPEFRILGPQIINRSSIVQKVGHGGIPISVSA